MQTSLLITLAASLIGAGDLDGVAKKVAGQIKANPGDISAVYHESMLQKLPAEKLVTLFKDFHKNYGKVISVTPVSQESPTSGKFDFAFDGGVKMRVTLTISRSPPPQVIGLWFGPANQSYKRIEEAVSDLKALPGTVNFRLMRLGEQSEVMHEVNADTPLGIGSTFKLYILAALVQDQKPWDDIVRLDPDHKSMPSGALQTWPDGSPLTVHSLATVMISRSDNTATDHLLHYVGRERVETMMAPAGNRNSAMSIPFLSTMEMFKLKTDEKLLKRYVKGDVSARRKLLRGKVARMERDDVSPYPDGRPLAIDTVEWFASAADLGRLMEWFHQKGDKTALAIMAVNKGLDVSDELYTYAGYKGGSEPGVLNMTWLLTAKSGSTYALTAGWNNAANEGCDLVKFSGIVQPIIDLLGKQ